jgi:hypothetical protein
MIAGVSGSAARSSSRGDVAVDLARRIATTRH